MKKIVQKLLSGSDRTKVVKKNILGSFGVKGLNILASLYLVPYTINLLDKEKYGIWITIYSIVTWVNMMDIGIGNGFRNNFTEAVARGNKALARQYVQTLYSAMGLLTIALVSIYLVAHPFINWNAILNVKPGFDENLGNIVRLVFCLFFLQLFLKNITTILLSLQKTFLSNLLFFLSNLVALIVIFFLQRAHVANLATISLAFMITPNVILLGFTLYFFLVSHREYIPELAFIPKKEHLKKMMTLGLKFFFIQITTVFLFSSDNIVITQLFGPADVTPYNIAYRLFSTTITFLAIVNTPFWSAFTEAHTKNDIEWIKRSMKKLNMVFAVFAVGIIILWAVSPYVIQIWVGKKVQVSYGLTLQFALFTLISGWVNPFVFYISSVGKIKLELWIALVQCVLVIPAAIFMAKYLHMGTIGVIASTNILLAIAAVFIPIQYYKLINGKATGIWNQ